MKNKWTIFDHKWIIFDHKLTIFDLRPLIGPHLTKNWTPNEPHLAQNWTPNGPKTKIDT